MKVRKCVSCGAPFGEVPEDAASLRCEFCGTVNETTVLRRGVQQVQIVLDHSRGQTARRASSTAVAGTLVILALTFAALGVGLYGAWSGLRAAFPGRLPRLPGEKAWTPATLSDLPARGRVPLEVGAPSSGFADFDPVTQIPWALAIAQGWSKDARLQRIDVSRATPAGAVDVSASGEAEVIYRFSSPARAEQHWREADRGAKAAAPSEMWVVVRDGATFGQALSSSPSRAAAPPLPAVLSLRDVMGRARPRLPPVPLFNGYMIHSGGEGWVWYLNTLSGRESIPRIRAADGRMWPYTGAAHAPRSRPTPRAPGRAPQGYSR